MINNNRLECSLLWSAAYFALMFLIAVHRNDGCPSIDKNETIHLNIILSWKQKSQNLNHFFRGPMAYFARFLQTCVGTKRALCRINNLNDYMPEGPNMKPTIEGNKFFVHAAIEEACIQQVNGTWQSEDDNHPQELSMEKFLTTEGIPGNSPMEHYQLYEYIKRGAYRLLYGSPMSSYTTRPILKSTGAVNNTRKILVVYGRQDAHNHRTMLNSQEVANNLTLVLPEFEVKHVESLLSLDMRGIYELFSTASVFLSVHGGWTPNVVFMPKHALVFCIEAEQVHYLAWEAHFNTPYLTVVRVTSNIASMGKGKTEESKKHEVFATVNRSGNTNPWHADVYLYNLDKIVDYIKSHDYEGTIENSTAATAKTSF